MIATEGALFVHAHTDDEFMVAQLLQDTPGAHVATLSNGEAGVIKGPGLAFVEDLGEWRQQQESPHGLAYLGVPPSHQEYLGFPDGRLQEYVPAITAELVGQALMHDVPLLVSPGDYEDHPDHRAARIAAQRAAETLWHEHGKRIGALILNPNHEGQAANIAVNEARKKHLMGYYPSQFLGKHTAQGFVPNPEFLATDFAAYQPLFARETYDLYDPAAAQPQPARVAPRTGSTATR